MFNNCSCSQWRTHIKFSWSWSLLIHFSRRCVIAGRLLWFMTFASFSEKHKPSLQFHFFTHPYRTRRIAARLRNSCVTSTKAVAMAASFTTWCIASWSRTARSARWSWSRRTGATPRAAGRPCSGPSARPAPTGRVPPRATGQVRLGHPRRFSCFCAPLFVVSFVLCGAW